MRRLIPAAAAVLSLLLLAPAAAAAAPERAADSVRVLVTLDDRVWDVPAAARASLPAGGRVDRTWSAGLKGYAATVPVAALPALGRAKDVRRVEPDVTLRATVVQPAPPVGLDRLDQRAQPLDESYRYDRTGAGVTAYVVDTGMRLTHTDFDGRARTGYDAVTSGGTASDCEGHGTHVGGTIGGALYGVAKSVTLSSVRVLDCDGVGSGSDLIEGLDFVIRDHRAGRPAVAVLSLGGDTASTTVDDAVRRVVADGVTVVVAAGNASVDACQISPARVTEVVTVGASDPWTDARAGFSNYGSCLDLYAPGVGIESAGIGSDVASAYASGTSMAAPHAAGAAALLLEADPTASPAAIAAALRSQATQDAVTGARGVDELLHVPTVDPVVQEPALSEPVRAQPPADSLLTPPSPAPVVSEPVVAEPAPVVAEPAPVAVEPAPVAVEPAPVLVAPAPLVPEPALPVDLSGRFTPVTPSRSLDTRNGTGGVSGRLEPGRAAVLTVTGRNGVPTSGVTAVALNVTVTGPESPGHLTVHPADRAAPTASSLNHVAAQTVANLVVTAVDAGGRIALLSNAGRPHVVADVVGFYSDASGGSLSGAVTPARLLDTRTGLGGTTGPLQAGRPISLQVAGRGGLPASGVTAVVVNVTATAPAATGHLTAFPGAQRAPLASSLNFTKGRTVPNLVVVGVGPGGDVQLQVSAGDPQVVVDVVGWFGDAAPGRFVSLAPQRVLDSRSSTGRLAPGQELVLDVGRSLPSDAAAVLVNVTAVAPTGSGHLTVFPGAASAPEASNLNHVAGQTVPNLVLVGVADGRVRLRSSSGSPYVLVDLVGYTAP